MKCQLASPKCLELKDWPAFAPGKLSPEFVSMLFRDCQSCKWTTHARPRLCPLLFLALVLLPKLPIKNKAAYCWQVRLKLQGDNTLGNVWPHYGYWLTIAWSENGDMNSIFVLYLLPSSWGAPRAAWDISTLPPCMTTTAWPLWYWTTNWTSQSIDLDNNLVSINANVLQCCFHLSRPILDMFLVR